MNKSAKPLLAVIASAVLMTPAVSAQDADADDIASYTCRSLLLASGDEREGTILVLHAYLLGENKQSSYDPTSLGEATDRLLDACIDKPDASALDTLRKVKS